MSLSLEIRNKIYRLLLVAPEAIVVNPSRQRENNFLDLVGVTKGDCSYI